jgi:signal peptidase II
VPPVQDTRAVAPLTSRATAGAIAGAVAAAVVILDQVTTTWVLDHLSGHGVHLIGFLALRLEFNRGVAFGLAPGLTPVIEAAAAFLVVGLGLATRRSSNRWQATALGLIAGGAIGNLVDRFFRPFHGAVVDFIYTGFWPTFNVADAAITVGVVLYLILAWRSARLAESGQPAGA